MKKTISIITADDHPIFREGVLRILEKETDLRVVASVGDGTAAWHLLQEQAIDIAILDISMPGLSGLQIAKNVIDSGLASSPIILTMYHEEEYLEEALEIGVTGYLLKDSTLMEIVECIRTVHNGGYYISKELTQQFFENKHRKAKKQAAVQHIEKLTATERLILKHLACNKTSTQIAKEMFVSFRTVQNHRVNIAQKLDLHGYNTLLQFALEHKDTF